LVDELFCAIHKTIGLGAEELKWSTHISHKWIKSGEGPQNMIVESITHANKVLVQSATHVKRGPIGVSDEAQCLTDYFLLFRVKILEDIVLSTYDSQGDWERVQ